MAASPSTYYAAISRGVSCSLPASARLAVTGFLTSTFLSTNAFHGDVAPLREPWTLRSHSSCAVSNLETDAWVSGRKCSYRASHKVTEFMQRSNVTLLDPIESAFLASLHCKQRRFKVPEARRSRLDIDLQR